MIVWMGLGCVLCENLIKILHANHNLFWNANERKQMLIIGQYFVVVVFVFIHIFRFVGIFNFIFYCESLKLAEIMSFPHSKCARENAHKKIETNDINKWMNRREYDGIDDADSIWHRKRQWCFLFYVCGFNDSAEFKRIILKFNECIWRAVN